MMPDSPQMMNMLMKPTAKSIGVLKFTEPLNIVPIQLKILTPVGTAMSIVLEANTASAMAPRPTANMWWAHTPKARKPMAMPEYTITAYPNRGLRENTGMISDTMPMPGKIRM